MNTNKKLATILFIDLSDSTQYKIEFGHKKGVERIIKSIEYQTKIINDHSGIIVKNLGDALLVIHDNPLHAINMALEIIEKSNQTSYKEYDLNFKISATFGLIESIETENYKDILGEAVDKCARINSISLRNQLLIDETIYNSIYTHFEDHKILTSKKHTVDLKNFNRLSIYEISKCKLLGIKEENFPPFAKEKILICDFCHKPITEDDIRKPGSLLTFEEDETVQDKDIIINVNFLHKGNCSANDYNTWREISEFNVPEIYLDFILTVINQLNANKAIYSEKARKKIFEFLFFMYPKVFRKSSTKEFEEFLETRKFLDEGF